MPYKLEQGIYYTSCSAFETTTGLGITASSRVDAQALQEMRRIANAVNFCENRTEYSFLYNSLLGFCTTATTVRHPTAGGRATPYIHMVFSGRHPSDEPECYGFRTRFETGEDGTLEGKLPLLAVEPLPSWNDLFDVSVPQVAWLIQRLWSVLCLPSDGSTFLLLSPDGLPSYWDTAEQLAQVVRKLAELVPASLRQNMRVTTATLPGKRQWPFNILLSRVPDAVRLDSLPVLEPDGNDYFGTLSIKMAESYLSDREEFRTLSNQIDREALTKIQQITTQRYALGACCVATSYRCRWSLKDEGLETAYGRVQELLRNEHVDLAFWIEQEKKLRQFVPPKALPELLKWFEDVNTPLEEQIKLLRACYHMSPNVFIEQFHHVDEKDRRKLTALWYSSDIDHLLKQQVSEDWNTAKGFYTNFCELLAFWTPLFSKDGIIELPRKYFSELLEQAPSATLEEMSLLFHTPRDLLQLAPQIRQLAQAVCQEEWLPSLAQLKEIPPELLCAQPVKSALEDRWKQAEEQLDTRKKRDEWIAIGKLLNIFDERSYIASQKRALEQIQTPKAAIRFAENALDNLAPAELNAFYRKVQKLIEDSSEIEDLRLLDEILKKYIPPHMVQRYRGLLDRKLNLLCLREEILHGSLRELLELTTNEYSSLLGSDDKLIHLWEDQVSSIQSCPERDSQLTPEDRGCLVRSSRWMECNNFSALAVGLCRYFFMNCNPSLRELEGVKHSGCQSYDKALADRLVFLSRSASLDELYAFAASGSEFDVKCPPEAWTGLTRKERMEILSKLANTPAAAPIYEKLLVPEETFCELLLRIFGQTGAEVLPKDEEWDMLFNCLASAAIEEPDDSKVFKMLLTCWRNSTPQPTTDQCKTFLQRVASAPSMEKTKLRRIFKSWKVAFKGTGNENMLEKEWKRTRGHPLAELSAEQQEIFVQSNDRPKPEALQGDTLVNRKDTSGILRALMTLDKAIYDFFTILSCIPRAPIRGMIWILRHLL